MCHTGGEATHVREQGTYGQFVYLTLNFAVNLKLNKVLKKKSKYPFTAQTPNLPVFFPSKSNLKLHKQ